MRIQGIAEILVALGVEKPTPHLVEEVERIVMPKINRAVEKAIKPHVVARAFAATLGIPAPGKKGVGEKHHALKQDALP